MVKQDCQEQPPNWWKCNKCGHTFEGQLPPEKCPSCQLKCTFANVSCYTPDCDCNGPDPKLL